MTDATRQPSRSSATTRPDQQLRRGTAAAPRSRPLADQLDSIIPRVDELTHRARLGHPLPPRLYDELEELADGIARDLRAAFRGSRPEPAPTAPILWRDPKGHGFLV